MTKETMLADLEQTTTMLLETIVLFKPQNFNRKHSETEWSAAQVAEHVLKVGNAALKAINGETIPTNRPPEQKIAILNKGLEDEATKLTAPERVRPSADIHEAHNIILQIKQQKEALEQAIHSVDMTDACMSFKHSLLGTLTRVEWLYFHIHHIQRHIKQLDRLMEKQSVEE
jgi:hypothetical protein